jgi:hypothetical protein
LFPRNASILLESFLSPAISGTSSFAAFIHSS